MPAAMELKSFQRGDVLVRQGEEANRLFVLQRGALASKLVPEKDRANAAALVAAEAAETWADAATIVGAESVLNGSYIESIVAADTSEVLVIPLGKKELVTQFATSPKTGLGFGRYLARKVMHANQNLTGSQNAVAKLDKELSGLYGNFFSMIQAIAADAEGDDVVLDALKTAKSSKTYSTGQRLSGDEEEGAIEMTRVIEAYEMTGNQHKIKKGEALCRAGDPGNSMFIVVKGKLAVVIHGDKVGEIKQGETVGEIAVLLGKTDQMRTADLIAEEATVVAIIPGDQFEKLAVVQPALLLQIVGALVQRVKNNYAIVADRDGREKKLVERFLGKADVNVEKDYQDFAKSLEALIEEFELPLYRELDLLERGIERIRAYKEKYAHLLPAEAAK